MPVLTSDELSDAERLAAIDGFDILDTPDEQGFDDIAGLARQICRTGTALVSIVTADRQWFKAVSGPFPRETPLGEAACAHLVAGRSMVVIPDLAADERTRDSKLVTGPPRIRFYAGAPLETSDGHVLGALCVIDGAPRPEGLSAQEGTALQALARQVVTLLELRRAVRRRESGERRYRAIFDAMNAGLCIVDVRFDEAGKAADYRFLEVNAAFEKQTGIKNASGRWMRDIAPGHEEHWFEAYGEVARTGRPARFENQADALGRWYDVYAFPAGGPEQRHVGILFNDVSEQHRAAQAARESEERARARQHMLNQELGHRLKNTFAMVQAISRQTLRQVTDRDALLAFNRRIMALSSGHDVLLQQEWTRADLRLTIASVLALHGDARRFDLGGPDVVIGANAVLSISLLIHELATNALKHGALSADDGTVVIRWSVGEGDAPKLRLAWRERGGPPARKPARLGFGSRLIEMGLVGTKGAALDYTPDGLIAEFEASLSRVMET